MELRIVECCASCGHCEENAGWDYSVYSCAKHDMTVEPNNICDDYE